MISISQAAVSGNKPIYPKISVITVVLNSKNLIERTMKSVLDQDYPNIEYIVIDGGSVDGTIKIINLYKSRLKYFLSEPDRGIYDAMNKGLLKAKGDWVNFMNAGDIFKSNSTISEASKEMNSSADILYGSVEINYHKFLRVEAAGIPKNLWKGMQFSHQSTFVDLSYHKKNLFNINNKIVADHEFFYKAYKSNIRFKNLKQTVSQVIIGGLSETNRYKTITSSCTVICDGKLKPIIRIYYAIQILNLFFKNLIKIILPKTIKRKLILMKYISK